MMHATSMHDLMLGMFLGGILLAAPPILIGIAIGAYLLHQRRQEQAQSNVSDSAGE